MLENNENFEALMLFVLGSFVVPLTSAIITGIVTAIWDNIDDIINAGAGVVEYLIFVLLPQILEQLPEFLFDLAIDLANLILAICDILDGDDCDDCDEDQQTVVLGGFTGVASGGFTGASSTAPSAKPGSSNGIMSIRFGSRAL